ncbi:MarR family winged helix-turn-helix transcriptional regulator [Corynebacterium pilosum]|uniref:MarR family winged helix-turn-helix transcriptional regulator n=1 Tax=Corynebacterium pilosum TaxID=35756 RepID=UPI000B254C79|nr:MarR family transcriptional regulator [Corynebacterium pilosum]
MNKTRWLNEKETDTWLALWAVSSWMPTRLDEQLKADSEMNLHDYFTLAQVSLADEGRLTMTELACRTQMSPSRLSHVVGRLEKRNLMQRTPDQEDRRTNIASITPQVGSSWTARRQGMWNASAKSCLTRSPLKKRSSLGR